MKNIKVIYLSKFWINLSRRKWLKKILFILFKELYGFKGENEKDSLEESYSDELINSDELNNSHNKCKESDNLDIKKKKILSNKKKKIKWNVQDYYSKNYNHIFNDINTDIIPKKRKYENSINKYVHYLDDILNKKNWWFI